MLSGRRGRCGDLLHHLQADHLTGNLRKALDPADDADKAILVDLHHIPGLVPAGAQLGVRRLQPAGLLVTQVTAHQVGAADMQHAATPVITIDARHLDQSRGDAGQKLSDTATAIRHRGIDSQHRSGLGRAVAFEDADPELVEPLLAHSIGELLGACDDIAQTVEIVWVSMLGVVAEKGRGPQQHGAATVIGQFGDDPVMERAGVEEHVGTTQHRQQTAGGEPEGVKQRQGVENPVIDREIDHRANLPDVGEQGAMGQHHPLGLAFGAGCEQHHGGILGSTDPCGRERKWQRPQHQPQFVAQRHRLAQVFQIQQLDSVQRGKLVPQPGLLDERA